LSEAAYLSEQAAAAQAAMRGALGDLQANLRAQWEQAADVQSWIQRHPWFAVGAASAAGFTAAAVVTPGPGESLGEKLSRAAEAFMPEGGSADGQEPSAEAVMANGRSTDRRASSIWAVLLEPVVEILKVAVENYLMTAMAGQAAAAAPAAANEPETDPADQNGSAEANSSAMT
jgi:hypothetical protein